ncbi:MAG: hypothetical protein KAY22_16940 [Rhizorhabdus sp.]|uniref:hypothetical protein n=1 Tax=Rhizorhabdus sp. TaxID=1968843 RepID=UPI001B49062F|nr:hypothetical protein [Rhizorhabdus sp.]MBP8233986.1 hypothetical protein [Rhizorhabdus sp.]
MSTPLWQAGTSYAPGAIVQPASTPAPQPSALDNGNFESGITGWTLDTGFAIGQYGAGTIHDGSWSLQFNQTAQQRAINDAVVEVVPGQSITASCQVQQGASSAGAAGARVEIGWYDASDDLISFSQGNLIDSGSGGAWHRSTLTATAPADAAYARFAVTAFRSTGTARLWVDSCTWDALILNLPDGLVFKAVQTNAGYSGSSEPVWPLVYGGTVVDNEVTWEAVYATRVVWEAEPLLVSGVSEPDWPLTADATVADGSITWVAMHNRITDEKCPQTAIVAIAAGKVFCADGDIIGYSATVNPLDWSSVDDAGFLPFGLQTYGSTPCTALGLYRSNLVAFNAEGYQMWQVDEDPANMALLDASPIDCRYARTVQPVSNDLVFCSAGGVRNIGTAGATGNIQAGQFGKAIDPLVLEKIRAGTYDPFALFWPSAGQYWIIFGDEAFVLTMNGGPSDASWSRYEFPDEITGWTLHEDDLYLLAGSKVWKMDDEQTADDVLECSATAVTETATTDIPSGADTLNQYSNSVLYPWNADEDDPRASLNIHTYSIQNIGNPSSWAAHSTHPLSDPGAFSIAGTFSTLEDALATANSEMERDFAYLMGYNAKTEGSLRLGELSKVAPYGDPAVDVEPRSIFLVYSPVPAQVYAAYQAAIDAGVSGGSYLNSLGIKVPGYSIYTDRYFNSYSTYGTYGGVWIYGGSGASPTHPYQTAVSRGDGTYNWGAASCLIQVDRDPGPPNASATLVAGSFKVLQEYLADVGDGTSQKPLNPCLEVGDVNDVQVYWEAAYADAVAAGTMDTGLVYGVDYPVAQAWAYDISTPRLGGDEIGISFTDATLTSIAAGGIWIATSPTPTPGYLVVGMDGQSAAPSQDAWTTLSLPDYSAEEFLAENADHYWTEGTWAYWLFDDPGFGFAESDTVSAILQRNCGEDGQPFSGYAAWHYVDFGRMGVDKQLEGLDLVVDGTVSISVGYDQKRNNLATTGYEIDGDTLPGDIIPLPLTAPSFQLRLTFAEGQAWEWQAASLWLTQG